MDRPLIVRRWSTGALLIASLGSLTALAIHGYLGYYSRYIADDFCSAGMAHRFGALRAVWYWYLNWTGRYSASALDAAFGLLGPGITPFAPMLALLIWLAALIHTTAALLQTEDRSRIRYSATIATIIVYVTLILSPNVPQSLYWGQGMRSIIPPLVLSTLYVDYLARVATRSWPARRHFWLLIADFLLTFVIGGFNETYAALQLAMLLCAVAATWSMRGWPARRRILYHLLAAGLGAASALFVVALSPGNAIRQAFYPPPPDLPHLLPMAWENFKPYIASLFGTTDRALAIIGAGGLAFCIGLQLKDLRFARLAMPVPLLLGLGLAFASFVPAAYGLSDSPPERTLLMPAHLLTLTIVLTGILLGGFLRSGVATEYLGSAGGAAVLLLASLALVSSVGVLDGKLVSRRSAHIQYAVHWDTVNAQILAARERGDTEIWIQPFPNWAGLNEPNDNPKFWVNVCLSEYYGIQVLGLDLP